MALGRGGVDMRIIAAILSVLLGTSLAFAQGDPRAHYGPITARSDAKAKAAKRRATGKRKPARAKKK